ncbi:MAG: multidrug ABC transporter ATP-binding protein [Pseudomonadales bacterium]|nr:multidrug ABC transporter ATP-binding protein [Pseudomonadales bacterium]RLU00997.1 MAG: ABC transporter ATP-binding protein [Ketobacter sp.]
MKPQPEHNELAIDVTGLVKRFGDKTVVNGVDIHMPEGRVWGFLGPNGSGKTTTIRMICGLLEPSAGEGTCLGYNIRREANQIKLATGYMTQRFSFWEDLSLRENLEFVARLYNLRPRRTVVDETLEKLGLQHRQHQLCGELSGGWKQRLALAAVTMHKPRLLLLDEPTAGVDPQARREFWDEIHLLTQQGLTVLVSTHYMDEAERCDEIVYLAHGELITQGTVDAVVRESRLITFQARGKGVRQLAPTLKGKPGLEHIAYFGSALHVSGKHRELMLQSLNPSFQDGIQWEEISPSLEDVFISLMVDAGVDKRAYE